MEQSIIMISMYNSLDGVHRAIIRVRIADGFAQVETRWSGWGKEEALFLLTDQGTHAVRDGRAPLRNETLYGIASMNAYGVCECSGAVRGWEKEFEQMLVRLRLTKQPPQAMETLAREAPRDMAASGQPIAEKEPLAFIKPASPPQPRMREQPVQELDATQLNAIQLIVAELDVAALHAAERNVAELDVAELDVAELNVAELNVAELNVAELDVAELNIAELDVAELNVVELNAAELYAAELDTAQQEFIPGPRPTYSEYTQCGQDLDEGMLIAAYPALSGEELFDDEARSLPVYGQSLDESMPVAAYPAISGEELFDNEASALSTYGQDFDESMPVAAYPAIFGEELFDNEASSSSKYGQNFDESMPVAAYPALSGEELFDNEASSLSAWPSDDIPPPMPYPLYPPNAEQNTAMEEAYGAPQVRFQQSEEWQAGQMLPANSSALQNILQQAEVMFPQDESIEVANMPRFCPPTPCRPCHPPEHKPSGCNPPEPIPPVPSGPNPPVPSGPNPPVPSGPNPPVPSGPNPPVPRGPNPPPSQPVPSGPAGYEYQQDESPMPFLLPQRVENPFPKQFPGSSWIRVQRLQGQGYYLEGRMRRGNEVATITASPGEYSPVPPRHLQGFSRYIQTKDGGYWVRVKRE